MNALQAVQNFATNVRGLFREPLTTRQGTSGTEIYGGYITNEDHNTEWHNDQVIENVDKMLRTDALIKASSWSYKLPIMAGTFSIKPASEQPIDLEIAEFVETNLFRGDNFNWNELIRQQLAYLDYGFATFSKQFKEKDGKTWLDRVIYLYPDTIERYFPDVDGDLGYIEQFAYDWRLGKWDTFKIDVEHLFLLTSERQGNNYRGTSMLRPCWASFKFKQLVMKLHAGAMERWMIGTPKGKMLRGDAKVADLKVALESIRSHEKGYVIETPEFEIDVLTNTVDGNVAMQAIATYNQEINTAFQREFMSLGKKGEGSLALGEVLEKPFYDSVTYVANSFADVWNYGDEKQEHIRQLVKENYSNVTEFPKMQISPKMLSMIIKVINNLPGLTTAGLLKPNQESIEAIHDALGLPEPDETDATIKPISEGMPPNVSTNGNGNLPKEQTEPELQLEKKSRNDRLEPSYLQKERKILNLQKMDDTLKKAHEQLRKDIESISVEIEKLLIDRGMQIFKKAQSLEELIELIDKTPVPLQGKTTNVATQNARRLFDFGRASVREETSKQKSELQSVSPPLAEDQNAAKKSLRQTMRTKVEAWLAKIMGEWKNALITMFKAGDFSTSVLRDSIQRISRNKVIQDLGGGLNEAHGLGRNSEIEKVLARNPDATMYRSEVLDESTCSPCVDIDGKKFTRNDEFYRQVVNGPYSKCEGRDMCRGINFVELP